MAATQETTQETTGIAPARLRLYEMPAAFGKIDAAIEDLDGELPTDIEAQLDSLEMALEHKAEAICGLIREASAEADYFESEVNRLASRKRTAAARAERLKAYLHETMTRMGRDRIDTQRFRVRVQRNSHPSIRWPGDVEALPSLFRRVVWEVDGRAIQAAHKAGTLPGGFEVVQGTHLRIS